jgi:hypothetical protein
MFKYDTRCNKWEMLQVFGGKDEDGILGLFGVCEREREEREYCFCLCVSVVCIVYLVAFIFGCFTACS